MGIIMFTISFRPKIDRGWVLAYASGFLDFLFFRYVEWRAVRSRRPRLLTSSAVVALGVRALVHFSLPIRRRALFAGWRWSRLPRRLWFFLILSHSPLS